MGKRMVTLKQIFRRLMVMLKEKDWRLEKLMDWLMDLVKLKGWRFLRSETQRD